MKPFNTFKAQLFPVGTVLNQNRTSRNQQVYNAFVASIQIVVSGTPNGTFSLWASADPFDSGDPGYPVNFTQISGSSQTITAAGSVFWNIIDPGYNYIQVQYMDASGGTSTATISSSICNGKGF